MKTKLFVYLLGILTAGMFLTCCGKKSDDDCECKNDQDCPQGYFCELTRCKCFCRTGTVCEEGSYCDPGLGECVFITCHSYGTECGDEADWECIASKCYCKTDNACREGRPSARRQWVPSLGS